MSKPSKVGQVERRVWRGVVMAQKAVVVGMVVLKELKPVTNQLNPLSQRGRHYSSSFSLGALAIGSIPAALRRRADMYLGS